MKTFVRGPLLAAGVLLAAPTAFAIGPADIARAIEAQGSSVTHQTAGKHHRSRGCRLSHGKLVCGGGGHDRGRSKHGGGNRHGGKKHGGGRH